MTTQTPKHREYTFEIPDGKEKEAKEIIQKAINNSKAVKLP